MLKVKHAMDTLTLLKDSNGVKAWSMEENKVWVLQIFHQLSVEDAPNCMEQELNSSIIKMARQQTIPNEQAKWLNKELIKEDVSKAIDTFKPKKSQWKDGLLIEFFKLFK